MLIREKIETLLISAWCYGLVVDKHCYSSGACPVGGPRGLAPPPPPNKKKLKKKKRSSEQILSYFTYILPLS